MRKLSPVISILLLSIVPVCVFADSSELTASVRIGIAYENDDSGPGDYAIRDFGSRLIWSGEKDLGTGLKGVGYIELGLNSDNNERGTSGADHTRQLWGGLSGGFGAIRIGAQYSAFYDLISVHTDIAWWGSCWTQPECERKTNVLKYTSAGGPITYAASITATADDEGRDIADEFEYGINFNSGGLLIGLAGSTQADDGANKGGNLIGIVLGGQYGSGSWAIAHQMADKEFVDEAGDVTHTTFSGRYGNSYLVYNRADNGSSNPQYATLGYSQLLGESVLVYYEYQVVDSDSAESDEKFVQVTFKVDF